jgi:hypothetical protein
VFPDPKLPWWMVLDESKSRERANAYNHTKPPIRGTTCFFS